MDANPSSIPASSGSAADSATRTASIVEEKGGHGESELIRKLQAGDDAAFEQVVREHGGRMLSVARRLLRNEQDAADAVQDAFIQAWRAIDRFDERSKLSTWLHRIVVNAALMKLRKLQRTSDEVSIDLLLPQFQSDGHPVSAPRPWRDPESELSPLEREETREIVRKKIDELPDPYRTVLLLRDIEGFDTEQTAQLLGIGANATKTRLHRARQALRTLLEPHLKRGDA